MADTAPFQVRDAQFKNLIEGNLFSTSHVFTDADAADVNLHLDAQQADGGFVIVDPLKITTNTNIVINFELNPDITGGTTTGVTKRRLDGPSPSSSAQFDVSTSNPEQTSEDKLVLSGTQRVGVSRDNAAVILPSGNDIVFGVENLQGANNVTAGFELIWAEVPDTIIPNLNQQ